MIALVARNALAQLGSLLAVWLAVTLASSLVAGAIMFSEAAGRALDQHFVSPARDVDVVVTAWSSPTPGYWQVLDRPRVDAHWLAVLARLPGVRTAAGDVLGYAQVVGPDGRLLLGLDQSPSFARAWLPAPFNAYSLEHGRPPLKEDEVVLDAFLAGEAGLEVGQPVRIALQMGQRTFRLTGIARIGSQTGSTAGAAVFFSPDSAPRWAGSQGAYAAIYLARDATLDPVTLAARVRAATAAHGLSVQLGADRAQADRVAAEDGVRDLERVLALFAGVGLVLGIIVIANAVSLHAAGRRRQWALLRTLGATPTQVITWVLAEGIGLAVLGTLSGWVLGLGVAALVQAAFANTLGGLGSDRVGETTLALSLPALGASACTSLATVITASLWPARNAGRAAPLEALRSADVETEPSGTRRPWWALGLTVIGAVLWAISDTGLGQAAWLGALLMGLGLLTLTPVWLTLLSAIARPLSVWPAAFLARAQVSKQARRLGLAVVLVTVAALGGALGPTLVESFRSGYGQAADDLVRADLIVYRPLESPGFGPQVPDMVRQTSGVMLASPVVEIDAGLLGPEVEGNAWAVDPATIGAVVNPGAGVGSLADLGLDSIAVHADLAEQMNWARGGLVRVHLPDGAQRDLRIVATYTHAESIARFMIDRDLYWAHTPARLVSAVYVRVRPGVDPRRVADDVRNRLSDQPGALLQTRVEHVEQRRLWVAQDVFFLGALFAVMLAVAVISVVNVLTTLLLQSRQVLALLGRLGVTRGQLDHMILVETALVAVTGVVLGLALGLILSQALVTAFPRFFALTVPWGTLLAVALSTVGACLLAAGVPIRILRADRLGSGIQFAHVSDLPSKPSP